MKKRLLFLPLIAAFALTGCDLFGGKKDSTDGDGSQTSKWDIECEFASGTEEEKNAILKAVNQLSICATGSVSSVFPDIELRLTEEKNDYIKLTKQQAVGSLTVNLEWSVDKSQATFKSMDDTDGNHYMIQLNYPGFGNPDTEFKWSLGKATCGSAVTSDTKCAYKATLVGAIHKIHEVSIGELYQFTETSQTFDGHTFPSTSHLFDYTNSDGGAYSIWWNTEAAPNTPDNFYYVKVAGKLVYMSPDGDWGLLADGDHIIEIYSGSGKDLKPEYFPGLKDDNVYVKVAGNMGTHYGNLQLGYITAIEKLTDAEIAALHAPGTFNEVSASVYHTNHDKQFAAALEPNSLKKMSGTLIAGSAEGEGLTKAGKRFSFKIQVGEETLTVAYDYHVDNASNGPVRQKLLALANEAGTEDAPGTGGKSLTVSGTLRFCGCAEKTLIELESPAYDWQLVPYEVAHIVG